MKAVMTNDEKKKGDQYYERIAFKNVFINKMLWFIQEE